ncbi:DUF3017 domain-containing protein [Tsukamurella sp. 8F]|uniref:DUF3017 domain-containing protein n=1 Tax=unclassified Tsukamurella TaxID=2633480 RepID=UPI0023B8F124|nr:MULTISPECIES: DUF3017 domain-containing protein [unclassified Tsukamurella]MDF0531828.1 DUF3017 domain-containing protein [Tsukamurella sp. 8J]MDF0589094.1 DUF3017 domain-containing protein [Tsukamurella sp. 8F]
MTNAAFGVVIVVLAAALLLIALERWRRGLFVFGSGTGLAAVLRAVCSDRRAGLLRVRSKIFDVAVLAVAAASILVIAWGISPLGTK